MGSLLASLDVDRGVAAGAVDGFPFGASGAPRLEPVEAGLDERLTQDRGSPAVPGDPASRELPAEVA